MFAGIQQALVRAISSESEAFVSTKMGVAELVSHAFAANSHRAVVYESIRRDIPLVLGTIGEVLMANPDSNDVITVKKDALKCILAWGAVEKGIPAE
ncbi:hypothetical protein HDU99_001633 [Rhizoclosmatium hyalinum]|nr:hypothetical protein HDU99_001633 [Rhizoclosmatium hyalinum]